jgi:hypothetical protein
MPADRTTALYSFPRLLAFTRTRAFIAVVAFISSQRGSGCNGQDFAASLDRAIERSGIG